MSAFRDLLQEIVDSTLILCLRNIDWVRRVECACVCGGGYFILVGGSSSILFLAVKSSNPFHAYFLGGWGWRAAC